VLEEAATLARQPPADTAVLARTLTELAHLRSVQARPADALALFREAIAAWAQASGPNTLGLALAQQQLGEELWAQRRYAEGVVEVRQAVQTLRERAGPEQVQTALMELNLGRMLSVQGKPLDGRPLLQHAATVLLSHGEDVSPQRRVDALVFLGESLLDAGEVAAAGAPLQQGVALDAARTPRADALPLLVLARQLLDTGRYDEALQALQRARERRIAHLGADHPQVAAVDNRIALVWMAQGRHDEAERGFRAIREGAAARGGPFGSMRDLARHNLATLQIERGRFDGALEPAQAALARLDAQPAGERNRSTEQALTTRLARVLEGLGRAAEARPYFERALALAVEDQHPQSPRLALARARLAGCLAALGERGAAATLLNQAEATAAAQPQMAPHQRAVVQQARRALSARA
jgi:tetratricopeptide (TPR) repeat protein